MQFRYARHTDNLEPLTWFYTEIIGLEKLGGFKDHDGYDGVFIGAKNSDWHLEFTTSNDPAHHSFDDDDLIVFYLNTEAEIKAFVKNARRNNIHEVSARNSYWNENGHTFTDPDGCSVVVSLRPLQLHAQDTLTTVLTGRGIKDWNEVVKFIQHLPYGRNSDRSDFSLVIKEGKGSCSSKHALLKKIADLNGIEGVSLILCMYKMTENNTHSIGHELSAHGLTYIPEAHCYLKLNGRRVDLTTQHADIARIENDILTEQEITPEQVIDFKVDFHKDFLRKWIIENDMEITFEKLWDIREKCIANLVGQRY